MRADVQRAHRLGQVLAVAVEAAEGGRPPQSALHYAAWQQHQLALAAQMRDHAQFEIVLARAHRGMGARITLVDERCARPAADFGRHGYAEPSYHRAVLRFGYSHQHGAQMAERDDLASDPSPP